MENPLLFFVLCFAASFVYGQTPTSEAARNDTAVIRVPIIRRSPAQVYYIDGVRVDNRSSGVSLSCGIVMLPPFDHICTLTIKQIMSLPQRNINSVAGVDSRAGETPYIRGARPENTAYYVDGMRVSFSCVDDMYVSVMK